MLAVPTLLMGQIGIKIPTPPRVVELFEAPPTGLQRIPVDSTLFNVKSKKYKRSVKMDSTARFISIRETLDNTDFFLPAVVDLETYIRLRLDYETRQLWQQIVLQNFKKQEERSSGAITLDIPFRIKSKTFTRIFGSDRIGLRVTGNISFDLSGRTEKRSGAAISALETQNTFSPRFKQTQQFTVEGHIGDKVTVSVEQNSEAVTDIENTLKLRYKGDEDEIIQSIEAGNIGLSLPSTRYVMFGGSNKGLFGLKTTMQLGNLHFTGIASLEKGQQRELTISGSATESKHKIRDIDFIKNRYFFIDMAYHDWYENGLIDNPQTWVYPPGSDIIQIDVYKSVSIGDPQGRYGVALIDPTDYWDPANGYKNVDLDDFINNDSTVVKRYFKQMDPSEFTVDRYRGFISLKQALSTQEVLAVAYAISKRQQDPNVPIVGTLQADLVDSQAVVLKLIKPNNLQPANKDTWPLMMRNVYSLGGTKIQKDGFQLRILYNVNGDEETHPEGSDKSFLNRLGLDRLDKNGEILENGDDDVDLNPMNINFADGLLIFPILQPFNPDPNGPWKEAMPDKYKVDVYNLSNSNSPEFLSRSKFDIVVTSKSTKSTFDLGFYVLEGSEEVTLGGKKLKRDKDYMIDYFSGQLTLLSPEAKRASSNISIKYERANLFQLDKKTIFGGRLEYRFWDDGFVGLTALYLNKSTLDQRVRVGQEPFENFVWDVNAAFKFRPRFLTKMIDALPFIETNAESQLNFETEYAQVLPNPNTLNNESTGDNNGVAYIDDFESSKRTTTLGIRYRTWTAASPPAFMPGLGFVDDMDAYKAKGRIAWFNPFNQVAIKEIWPNRDVNAQTGQTTDVLGVDFWREPGSDPDSAWVGFMRSTVSFPDQQKTKYIEIMVKGYQGTMHIDIGRISEDWYLGDSFTPRFGRTSGKGVLNHEDFNFNNLLDEGEDIGVDGLANPDGDPYDDWKEVDRDNDLYDGINGTEGNSNTQEARYPDTEDLDGDGQLSTTNAYYEYSFSLDTTGLDADKWVGGKTATGWRLFRIPLKEFTNKIGNPDPNFQQILNFRIWLSDLPEQRARIYIAAIDFVGNEWEEIGISPADTNNFIKSDSLFKLETVNTEENTEETATREAYHSPPGVTGVRDRITKALSKEQSLAMRFELLEANYKAEAKKTLYNPLDMSNYERLKMFIHGDRNLPDKPPPEGTDSSSIRFYMRFGSDQNNYYEYGQDIYAHWSPLNNVDIDLDELSGIKFIDSLRIISAEQRIFLKHLSDVPGGYFKAVGNPSIKTIRYIILGVLNKDFKPVQGEIWLDELRLVNVRKINATALRLKTSLKLADFISVNAQWESKEADFHNISEQFGKGNTEERQSYSGKIYLGKILPAEWDISLPVDARASFSRNIPKYFPRSDKLTNYQNPTIKDKLESLIGIREVPKEIDEIATKSQILGAGTTIRKRSKSKNWLLRATIDQLLIDVDWASKKSSSWNIEFNNSEQIKESIKYSIPFANDNYIMPLKWTANIPLLKVFADQKLFYTPNKINMSLTINDTKMASQKKTTSLEGDEIKYEVKKIVDLNTNRSINLGYRMLGSLNFTYSRNHRTDADYDSLTHKQLLEEIITKGNFGKETDISQNFKADFKPDLFKWLKTDFSFTSGFRYQLSTGYRFKNSSNNVQKRLSLTFSPGSFLKFIYNPNKSKRGSTTSRRGRPRRGAKTSEKDLEKNKTEKKDSGESPLGKSLMLLYNAFSSWQSIKATLTIDDNVSNKYLNDIPTWQYQFGLSNDPGVGQDSSLLDENINLIGPVLAKRITLNTSTSLDIMKNVRISFTHNYGASENTSEYGRIRSGSRQRTFFILGDNPLEDYKGFDKDIRGFIPDWNVQVSGLEKLPIISQFAKSLTLDHARSGRLQENLKVDLNGNYGPTNSAFSSNWQPLVGLNLRTVWDISANFRWASTQSYSYNTTGGATRTETNTMTFALSYSVTSGFKIPIPVWPFKGQTFKNEINLNLTFDASSNKTYQKQFDVKDFVERQNNKSWKLRPSATYRFSSRVQGSLFYETGESENKISGKYSYNEFGITVNIAIRD